MGEDPPGRRRLRTDDAHDGVTRLDHTGGDACHPDLVTIDPGGEIADPSDASGQRAGERGEERRLARESLGEPVGGDHDLRAQQRCPCVVDRADDGPLHATTPVHVLSEGPVGPMRRGSIDPAGCAGCGGDLGDVLNRPVEDEREQRGPCAAHGCSSRPDG